VSKSRLVQPTNDKVYNWS